MPRPTHGTVYLIAQPTISRHGRQLLQNPAPLTRYGDLKVLVLSGEFPSFNPERVLSLIRERLAKFDPTTDYLVWAGGDTLAAVLAGVALTQLGHTRVQWLRFDRGRDPADPDTRTDHDGRYIPVDIPLNGIPLTAKAPSFTPDEGVVDDDEH
jgi:hypothetical protein